MAWLVSRNMVLKQKDIVVLNLSAWLIDTGIILSLLQWHVK